MADDDGTAGTDAPEEVRRVVKDPPAQLGSWDPRWDGPNAISFFLYVPVLVLAGYAMYERRRLDRDRVVQRATRQIPQCVPHSLTLFTQLLFLSILMRAVWFFARATNILGAHAPNADTCYTGFDCRERLGEGALDRVGQLVLFSAFSLVISYWDWWGASIREVLEERGGERGGEEEAGGGGCLRGGDGWCFGYAAPGRRWLDVAFVIADVWLVVIQGTYLALRVAVPFKDRDIELMDLGYEVQVAVLYFIMGGLFWIVGYRTWVLLHNLMQVQTRWLATVMAGGGEKSKGGGVESVLDILPLLPHQYQPTTQHTPVLTTHTPRSHTTPSTPTSTTTSQSLPAPSSTLDPSLALLGAARWRVGVAGVVCGGVMIIKATAFAMQPLSFQLYDWFRQAAFPWLLYTLPDLIAAIVTLLITAPHRIKRGRHAEKAKEMLEHIQGEGVVVGDEGVIPPPSPTLSNGRRRNRVVGGVWV